MNRSTETSDAAALRSGYETPLGGAERTRRALLIANRSARRVHDQLPLIVPRLRELGLDVFMATDEKHRSLADSIREHRDEVDLVIVAGGDGTLNQLVEALVETRLPLGILPLGTANDLARTLKIPADMDAACRLIARGHTRRIDLGWVNGKYFFNVAGVGISVRITQALSRESKRRWGGLAYLFTAAKVLHRMRPFHAEIRSSEGSWSVKTVQILVGNGRSYGGGLAVSEDATIDDQRLDLVSLEVQHWSQLVWLLPALWRGRLESFARVRTLRGRYFEVHTRKPRAISTDGELTARTSATFRVVPRVLEVFAR